MIRDCGAEEIAVRAFEGDTPPAAATGVAALMVCLP
jgi:hypothetical protein